MANQWDAAVVFHPCAWRAYDEPTEATVTVIDSVQVVRWVVARRGHADIHGNSKTPQAARDAARRVLRRIGKAAEGKR